MNGPDAERVRTEIDGNVAVLSLNRPEKRNALDAATIGALKAAIARCDADPVVRVMLLRGEGRDFCAGADLEQLERIAAGASREENVADAMTLGGLFIDMRSARKPIIAAVNGHALAGGAGLATAADLIVAAETAIFGYPEIHLGFVPAMVTALLRRAIGEKATFEKIVLGERFSAADAARIGLVCRVLPAATFDKDALAFAHELAKRSADALALCKQLLYGTEGMSFEEAIRRGAEINAIARESEDCLAGVRAFLARKST